MEFKGANGFTLLGLRRGRGGREGDTVTVFIEFYCTAADYLYINSVRMSLLEKKSLAKRECLYSVIVCWLFVFYVNRTCCVFLMSKWSQCVLVVCTVLDAGKAAEGSETVDSA